MLFFFFFFFFICFIFSLSLFPKFIVCLTDLNGPLKKGFWIQSPPVSNHLQQITIFNLYHCLFVLRLNIPVNNFFSHVGTEPTLPGLNQYCRELMCLAQGHNTVPLVGIEPRTSLFGV